MNDSERISQLEKEIKDIKNKIRKDKKENPDYKKKEPTEYNKFIKKESISVQVRSLSKKG
jgi:hypothetical protein